MSDDLEPVIERAIFLEIDTLTERVHHYLSTIPTGVTIGLDF
jgi:hypothetical protein